jgi:hypothetical protein
MVLPMIIRMHLATYRGVIHTATMAIIRHGIFLIIMTRIGDPIKGAAITTAAAVTMMTGMPRMITMQGMAMKIMEELLVEAKRMRFTVITARTKWAVAAIRQ